MEPRTLRSHVTRLMHFGPCPQVVRILPSAPRRRHSVGGRSRVPATSASLVARHVFMTCDSLLQRRSRAVNTRSSHLLYQHERGQSDTVTDGSHLHDACLGRLTPTRCRPRSGCASHWCRRGRARRCRMRRPPICYNESFAWPAARLVGKPPVWHRTHVTTDQVHAGVAFAATALAIPLAQAHDEGQERPHARILRRR